jgi:hypothetical protein
MADLDTGVGFSQTMDTGALQNVPGNVDPNNLDQRECPQPISDQAHDCKTMLQNWCKIEQKKSVERAEMLNPHAAFRSPKFSLGSN